MEDVCVICGIEDVSDLGTQVCYKCSKSIDNLEGDDYEQQIYISDSLDSSRCGSGISLRNKRRCKKNDILARRSGAQYYRNILKGEIR